MEQNNDGSLSQVRHVVLVLSGKGGVGKSTITTELALALRHAGKKVGILDVDLCGPSIPRMLCVGRPDVHQCDSGWVPVYTDAQKSLALMSIGFLLEDPDEAVVWRGPKKNWYAVLQLYWSLTLFIDLFSMIGQFVSDVAWGELDVPAGGHAARGRPMNICQYWRISKNTEWMVPVLVTTPQSTGDVRREITFCKKTGVRILGIVENMSGFVCPHCSECSNIFSKGGGEELAKLTGSMFLGSVPLDPLLSKSIEEGRDFTESFPDSATFSAISSICQTLLNSLETA
ncbi:Cytosolic Fe-S cluster assembly factor nubp2 [Larimichthys crocea]|uniref:Cytosolic Fe-S cluster assembly factor nubp2 n=1 Tax=Larimichthys crocea TaxID=215358 RepID=A0A6G0HYR7_LARCR|nr:Cytosolic Fe-S cluster assembly factor nubp2 [Larimichthys crocea]